MKTFLRNVELKKIKTMYFQKNDPNQLSNQSMGIKFAV